MRIHSPEIGLTPDSVAYLRTERGTLQRRIIDDTEAVREIDRKLEAIAVLAPHLLIDLASQPDGTSGSRSWAPQGVSLTEEVVKVISAASHPMTTREVREVLTRAQVSVGSENYLYTAIRRAAEKGLITRVGNTYVAAEPAAEAAAEPQIGDDLH